MKKTVFSQTIAVAITAFSAQLAVADVFEDFESGPGGFLENTSKSFSVSNGRYIFYGNRDSRSTYFLPWSGGSNPGGWGPRPNNTNYFDNFTVFIDSLWEGGANDRTYGLFICGQKNGLGTRDYVGFFIDGKNGTGYGIVIKKDDKVNIPVNYTPSSLVVSGNSNNLSIKKSGHELRFYINSTEVEQLSVDWCEGGSVGIEVSQSVNASFDNFKVQSIAQEDTVTVKTPSDVTYLEFRGLKDFYQVGETLVMELVETVNRDKYTRVDLWVAIELPSRNFFFRTEIPLTPWHPNPQPHKTSIENAETSHNIFDFEVPEGMGGDYTLYAVYVKEGENPVTNGFSIRSNLVMRQISLANRKD